MNKDRILEILDSAKDKNDAVPMRLVRKAFEKLPSAEPDRLTDDDFETIRIHLNAHKEKLCNQRRWEEAEEYQRIINRFMSFASAQPDLQPTCNQLAKDTNVPCKDTISRQDAIDLVRNCNVKEVTPAYLLIDKAEIMAELAMLPSAQPEIIRCRNCKHSHLTYDGRNKYCVHWPNNVFSPTEYIDGDFYCGFAKRREE